MSILLFIVILLSLILVHEFGHFSVAKLFKIRVDEFGVGFPPKLWGVRRGETEYTVNALPFGGFVRIYGEDVTELDQSDPDALRSFAKKSKWIQAAVLIAGVGMNIVAAWAILSAGYMVGLPAARGDAGLGEVTDTRTTVLGVAPGSPAETSGLIAGERIVRIESETGAFLEEDALADDVRHFIAQHGNEDLTLTLARGTYERAVTMRPVEGLVEGKAALGVMLEDVGVRTLPLHLAVIEGAVLTWRLTIETAQGLGAFFAGIFSGNADFSSIAGPVGIVGVVGEASQFGLVSVLMLAAVISINLAIINLIPFPALDGGRLLMVAIEAVVRRPIPQKAFLWLNGIGFAALILLMLVVTYNDIAKLF